MCLFRSLFSLPLKFHQDSEDNQLRHVFRKRAVIIGDTCAIMTLVLRTLRSGVTCERAHKNKIRHFRSGGTSAKYPPTRPGNQEFYGSSENFQF